MLSKPYVRVLDFEYLNLTSKYIYWNRDVEVKNLKIFSVIKRIDILFLNGSLVSSSSRIMRERAALNEKPCGSIVNYNPTADRHKQDVLKRGN